MSFFGLGGTPAGNVPMPYAPPIYPTAPQPGMPTNTLSYDPSQIAPTQANVLGGIQGLGQYNTYGQALPQAWGVGQGMVSDPNAAAFQAGAGTAANLGQNAAFNMYGAGGQLYNTAFDPQNALYQQQQQLTNQQAGANAAAAGLGQTPLGVSATDWANNQFNINWQNAQLQRQISGSQAASQLQGQAAPLYYQSAQYPYQTSQGIGTNQLNALNAVGQYGMNAAQIPGQQIAGWQQSIPQQQSLQGQANQQQQQAYANQVGWNQQQFQNTATAAQLGLQQSQLAWNQQQQAMSNVGNVLGGLGGLAMGAMLL
jgi:hypothetical protein